MISLNRPGNFGLSARRLRYIHYDDHGEELDDTEADRYEWDNLATRPEYVSQLAQLRALAPQTFAPYVPPSDASLSKLSWHPADQGPAPAINES